MYFLSNRNNTFLSYPERIFGLICLALVLFQITTVIPILNFFTRKQFYSIIYHEDDDLELTPLQFHGFNIIFNLLCLGFAIPAFEPLIVISLTGAFGGLILIYILPNYCHLKCMYLNKQEKTTHVDNVEAYDSSLISLDDELNNTCRDKDHIKHNVYLVYIFYSILTIFGIFVFGVSLYTSILKIINYFK